jgi:PIN domain nuclease of toxin-antitoxin system
MNVLLDTHTLLWFISGDERTSQNARNIIESDSTKLFVSIASLWEIAIKINIGKLDLHIPFKKLQKEVLNNNFTILPIEFTHTVQLSKLEPIHRDPFDRILISQALVENLTIISKDTTFSAYKGLKTSW